MTTETQARGWVSDLSENGYGLLSLSLSLSLLLSYSLSLSLLLSYSLILLPLPLPLPLLSLSVSPFISLSFHLFFFLTPISFHLGQLPRKPVADSEFGILYQKFRS